MDINTEARAEDLSIEQWIQLSNLVDERKFLPIIDH
jgi:16S rRNA A1518/A1519 N6-dimethyltransferase RsmA/KsgA/DIM1 with predicted DNA glycosylase/AP lyase activity